MRGEKRCRALPKGKVNNGCPLKSGQNSPKANFASGRNKSRRDDGGHAPPSDSIRSFAVRKSRAGKGWVPPAPFCTPTLNQVLDQSYSPALTFSEGKTAQSCIKSLQTTAGFSKNKDCFRTEKSDSGTRFVPQVRLIFRHRRKMTSGRGATGTFLYVRSEFFVRKECSRTGLSISLRQRRACTGVGLNRGFAVSKTTGGKR